MNYEVSIWYSDGEKMVDFLKLAEAFGAKGERVERSENIGPAIQRALRWMKQTRRPAIIDIIVERETDASMGTSIGAIRKFEEEWESKMKESKLKVACVR